MSENEKEIGHKESFLSLYSEIFFDDLILHQNRKRFLTFLRFFEICG